MKKLLHSSAADTVKFPSSEGRIEVAPRTSERHVIIDGEESAFAFLTVGVRLDTASCTLLQKNAARFYPIARLPILRKLILKAANLSYKLGIFLLQIFHLFSERFTLPEQNVNL